MTAGFPPSEFYQQTPLHFQVIMEAVRERYEAEFDAGLFRAYHAGAFAGLAYHGKLKRFSEYSKRGPQAQGPRDMLAALKTMGAGSNMRIKRVKLAA